jgi:hypothetical protein
MNPRPILPFPRLLPFPVRGPTDPRRLIGKAAAARRLLRVICAKPALFPRPRRR